MIRIGSLCGTPFHMDQCTLNKSRLSFARLLVEMDIHDVFPDDVILEDANGRVFVQTIEYE